MHRNRCKDRLCVVFELQVCDSKVAKGDTATAFPCQTKFLVMDENSVILCCFRVKNGILQHI